jgi:hypothetical protein
MGVQQRRKNRCRSSVQCTATASSSWNMASRMIRVPWRVVWGNCGSRIGEVSRMWSAVCSRTSTAAVTLGRR